MAVEVMQMGRKSSGAASQQGARQEAKQEQRVEPATNSVVLHGTVRRPPQERDLPSGDRLLTLRVVVPRDRVRADERRRSDWVDCVVWQPRLQQRVAKWSEGDRVEVRGALRRRFFCRAGGPETLVEVELLGGRVLRRSEAGARQSSGAR